MLPDFLPAERWLPVVGWEGRYAISSLGRVRSLPRPVYDPVQRRLWTARERILRPGIRNGYPAVSLSPGTRVGARTYPVHRLVALAFLGPDPFEGAQVCHNDGDRTNPRLDNLRWGSQSDNQRDAVRHGTHACTRKTHCKWGHEFTPENTAVGAHRNRPPQRVCRTCKAARSRARRDSFQEDINA
jgi:hypothetical protein